MEFGCAKTLRLIPLAGTQHRGCHRTGRSSWLYSSSLKQVGGGLWGGCGKVSNQRGTLTARIRGYPSDSNDGCSHVEEKCDVYHTFLHTQAQTGRGWTLPTRRGSEVGSAGPPPTQRPLAGLTSLTLGPPCLGACRVVVTEDSTVPEERGRCPWLPRMQS